MSSNSDQFEEMNYSFISSDKNGKEEEEEISNNIKENDVSKKQNLTKCLSSSGFNIKKLNDMNIFPEINTKKKKKISIGKKMNFTSNSFKSLKNNSFKENAYRTYTLGTNLINNVSKEKIINDLNKSKNEKSENILSENTNQIKPLSNNINNIEQKPNIINILNTKNNDNKSEVSDKNIFQDSQRIKKEYNNIQTEYIKKKNSINSLKEEEKISKDEELEMKNNILMEQINKLNYLYFNVLQKLIEYEDSIKNINKLKESKLKNDYIIIELEYKYNHILEELNKSNKKIEEMKYALNKKNLQLKHCQKNLDYYFQLNRKLLIDAENVFMSPKFLALKNDYETKINENKKKLEFYKEENYKKDKIILEFNCGNKNINELYNSINNPESQDKNCYFKNAQKLSKEYFIKNKASKENKEIISLKNKINVLQEKIGKLNKIIKEYEANEKCHKRNRSNHYSKNKKKINLNNNIDNYIFNKNNLQINKDKITIQYISKHTNNLNIKNKDDIDIDFMSNVNMNEFLYILKKCFEAQYISTDDIKKKVLNIGTFNVLKSEQKSKYYDFINKISENFFELIKIEKTKDKSEILSFVKSFLFNNYIENGENIDEFQKLFENSFKDIITYDKKKEEKYLKKLAKYFKNDMEKLKNEFEFIDFNGKGNISFIALEKVIEKLKINLKNDVLEYMIFFMKRSSINDINNVNNYSLKDLNYKILLDKISSQIKLYQDLEIDSNSNLSEIDNNNFEGAFNGNTSEDNSLIEITNEEYNEKISLIMNTISSEILNKCNKNTEEYINKLFEKYITTDEIGHQMIELTKLVEEVKNSLFIELNQIDIFCLYSRFQINENNNKNSNNNELIDFKSFKNEILLYVNQIIRLKKNNELLKANNNNNNKDNTNDIAKDIEDINKIIEKDDKMIEEIEEIKKQNEEYNDFENNNFDKEE